MVLGRKCMNNKISPRFRGFKKIKKKIVKSRTKLFGKRLRRAIFIILATGFLNSTPSSVAALDKVNATEGASNTTSTISNSTVGLSNTTQSSVLFLNPIQLSLGLVRMIKTSMEKHAELSKQIALVLTILNLLAGTANGVGWATWTTVVVSGLIGWGLGKGGGG